MMTTFEQVVNILTDNKTPYQAKREFIELNELSEDDLIDIANYVTIERNFYKRQCERLKIKVQSRLQGNNG